MLGATIYTRYRVKGGVYKCDWELHGPGDWFGNNRACKCELVTGTAWHCLLSSKHFTVQCSKGAEWFAQQARSLITVRYRHFPGLSLSRKHSLLFFRYKYKLMNSWNFISSYISVLYVTASLKGALNSKRGQHIASSFIASEMHALSGTFA